MASLFGSMTGSGATATLLPALALYFGMRDRVPILTIANLASNLSRIWFNRRAKEKPIDPISFLIRAGK